MIHEVKAVQEWYACKVKVTSPLTKEDIRSVVREAVWEREEHIADRLRFANTPVYSPTQLRAGGMLSGGLRQWSGPGNMPTHHLSDKNVRPPVVALASTSRHVTPPQVPKTGDCRMGVLEIITRTNTDMPAQHRSP